MTTTTKTPRGEYVSESVWSRLEVESRYIDEIDICNNWLLPIMKHLGIDVNRDNITEAMAADDKKEHFKDLIFARLGQDRTDIWRPSVTRALTKEADRLLDAAVEWAVLNQPPYIRYEADLARGRKHYDDYMADPLKYEDEEYRKRIRNMRTSIFTRNDADQELAKLRTLKDQLRLRWESRMDDRKKEVIDTAKWEWERIARTSYDVSKMWKYIDIDTFQRDGILTLDTDVVKDKAGTFARTDKEQELYDLLTDVCERCNAIFGEGARAALLHLTTENARHEMVINPGLSQGEFTRYANKNQ